MAGMIDDEVLGAFAVHGTVEEVTAEIFARYHGVADRVTLYAPGAAAQPYLGMIARRLSGLTERQPFPSSLA
jgi:hypothetical protein